MFRRSTPLLALALLAGCAAPPALLFDGLNAPMRELSSPSEEARAYLHQGLVLTWGFNHREAIRSFEKAAALDPHCPLAWWGVAYALGPNLNAPMVDPDVAERAYDAAQRAYDLREYGSPAEQALVDALVTRYADPAPQDRAELDQAFAAAMADAWAAHPDDALVGCVYADAMMNTSPWEYWNDDGTPREFTENLLATLEAVLELNPQHPFANHLYVHATEASEQPERGEAAADRLGGWAPGQGHLVHMPSHTYMRIGRYADAADANRKALVADDAYFRRVGTQDTYHFYRAHNAHFLAYAAMFQGDPAGALDASRNLVSAMPDEILEQAPEFVEGFLSVPWHVMVRFGMWDMILAEPEPYSPMGASEALWHYARGVALANLDRTEEARAEAEAFEVAVARIPEEVKVALSEAGDIMPIARNMLLGETLYREGDVEGAFAALREAVEHEDALPYNEPRGWMQPVRHALGALLLEQGRLKEAEQVYRADLENHPENGWALHGLAECLERTGKVEEAAVVTARFEAAWARSPLRLEASCYCRRS